VPSQVHLHLKIQSDWLGSVFFQRSGRSHIYFKRLTMMRKTFISAGVLALGISAGAALAADLPSKKAPLLPPPPPPPLFMWTGFYVGLNAGGTWGENNSVRTTSFPVFGNPDNGPDALFFAAASAIGASAVVPGGNTAGFIGGGQIGYNRQINSFVVGVEADIQGVAGASGGGRAVTVVPFGPSSPIGTFVAGENLVTSITSTKRLDYLGTVRGRLGWLAMPTLLVYGTGGLAYGGVSTSTAIAQFNNDAATVEGLFAPGFCAFFSCLPPAAFSSGAFSDTRVGWTVGGGGEWMFWPNWSAKVEYLYYDLGSVTHALSPLVTGGGTFAGNPMAIVGSRSSTRFNGHIVRAGLNYHFNWGALPVVAKF
jgi:outer membrane immunogenic protein